MTFHAQILTLYPEMFPGPLGISLAGRALDEGEMVLRTDPHPRLCNRQASYG